MVDSKEPFVEGAVAASRYPAHEENICMAARPRFPRRGLRPFLLVALLTLALAPGALACSKNNQSTGPQPTVYNPASSGTVAAPAQPPDDAPLAEFRMRGSSDDKGKPFEVSGKIIVMGIDPKTNVMQSPNNKDDVAYYDFSTHPGNGCSGPSKCANTVLSGHVDWFTGQTGVFWNLRFLKEGDRIDLKLADGVMYEYKVVPSSVYKDAEAPIQDTLGDTPQESVTLITCDGVFNKQLQEYNSRRIVRAVRQA